MPEAEYSEIAQDDAAREQDAADAPHEAEDAAAAARLASASPWLTLAQSAVLSSPLTWSAVLATVGVVSLVLTGLLITAHDRPDIEPPEPSPSPSPCSSFHSCPAASRAALPALCSQGAYSSGEWRYSPDQWYPYIARDTAILFQCDEGRMAWLLWHLSEDEAAQPQWRFPLPLNSSQQYVRPALKYVWEPGTCRLHDFPRAPLDFCLALNDRPLLLVGDSIMKQLYWSLGYLLSAAPGKYADSAQTDYCQRLVNAHRLQRLHDVCAGSRPRSLLPHIQFDASCQQGRWSGGLPASLQSRASIAYVRNDYLTDATESGTLGDGPWRHLLQPRTILLANAGVHVLPADEYREELTEALSWVQSQHPNVTVIWRTTAPGHAYCHERLHAMPLTNHQYELLNGADSFLLIGENAQYHWSDVVGLNAVAASVISELHSAALATPRNLTAMSEDELLRCLRDGGGDGLMSPGSECVLHDGGVEVLDIYPLDRLRPDSHRAQDCLHQCLPGPLDEWTKILFNLLVNQAS